MELTDEALPDEVGGWFWVYMLAPVVGGCVAAAFFTWVLEPVMKKAK